MSQLGINGHQEYKWSDNIQEKIVQFHSQLVRTRTRTRTTLENIESLALQLQLRQILQTLSSKYLTCSTSKDLLIIMYKMIGYTRDIVEGKGEYLLSYMMIYVWYDFFPELSKYAINLLVSSNNDSDSHPYGSWKDIKYFCNYCKNQNDNHLHPLISHCIQITNETLLFEYTNTYLSNNNNNSLSLISKWIPREKSKKFGWLFKELAIDYFSYYFTNTNTNNDAAIRKAYTNYRHILSNLNSKINTTQIKQCANKWKDIQLSEITSITLHKQKYALLNTTKDGNKRSNNLDRIVCSENFINKNSILLKSNRISINEFTQEALDIINNRKLFSKTYLEETNILNCQWNNYIKQINNLTNIIPIIDTSYFMYADPLNAAIALSICISQKSEFAKRILTFDAIPSWLNLDHCNNFVDMVEYIYDNIKNGSGLHPNFYACIDIILDTIIREKISSEIASNMVLLIISDMQIDYKQSNYISMYNGIKNKYISTGLLLYNKPIETPHIIFWNIKSTNSFPVLPLQSNVSMFSGYSPFVLNIFSKTTFKKKDSIQLSNPLLILKKILANKRYDTLEKKLIKMFH